MDRASQKELFEEICGYYGTNSTKLAASEKSHRASTYFDPGYLEHERELLRSYPQIIAHASRLAAEGDFIAQDTSGVPIIVSRQNDGSLKAFLNVCTHRGSKVCTKDQGHQSQFTCPYHGWTFRNDGQLMGVPANAFPTLDRAATGLTELGVEERHGLIWVVTKPGINIDVAAHLGALDKELESYGFDNLVLEREEVLTADINWKSVLDGFLEVYHFPKLHANSIAPYFYGTHSPFDTFGLHGRLVGIRKSFDTIKNKAFADIDIMAHIAVNYQLFPNTIGVWQGDHFEFWTAYPGPTAGTCTVRVQMLTAKVKAGPEFKKRWDRNWKIMIDTVVNEDWAMSHEVQKTLPFVKNDKVIFGANEPGLQHFHSTLDAIVGVARNAQS